MAKKLLAGLIITATAVVAMPLTSAPNFDTAHAQQASLAGQKGKVRRRLPTGKGGCVDMLNEYIAARGHSAYASTSLNDFNAENYICGAAINAKTTKQAEAVALRNCEAGTKKWKHAYKGKCEIHASK